MDAAGLAELTRRMTLTRLDWDATAAAGERELAVRHEATVAAAELLAGFAT